MSSFDKLVDSYNQLITHFSVLHSSHIKKHGPVSITSEQMETNTRKFCDSLKDKKAQSYLASKNSKLFKAINMSFIPKVKMEVALLEDNVSNDKKVLISKMWDSIYEIHIYGNELYRKETVNNILDKLGDTGLVDEKWMSCLRGIKSTDNGNKLADDILNNLSQTVKPTDGEVNTKEHINTLVNLGKDIAIKYKDQFANGDMQIDDIISGLMGLATKDDFINSLQLNKLNVNDALEVAKDFVPPQYVSLLDNLDKNALQNLDLNNLGNLDLSALLGGNTPTPELTEEQRAALLEYYQKQSKDNE